MIEMQTELIRNHGNAVAYEAAHDRTAYVESQSYSQSLEKEISRAGRHGDALVVGMCDVDHFKQINDVYGI